MANHKMQARVRYSPIGQLVFAILLPCFGFCNPPGSWARAAREAHGVTHFVALNGSDSGSGTADSPWATINHATEEAVAGDTVVLHGGRYILPAQVRPRNSGRSGAWITFVGYPGEEPILDAQMIPHEALHKGGLNNGAFQIEDVSYVRLANISVINSHDSGITVRDSSHIDLINNSTNGTFSSGIAVWDTNHDDSGTEHIRIIGNTIKKANTWDLAPSNMPRRGEPPHEALSIGGAVDFEVAYNHVYDSSKEGIDIKETSKRGKVHHNLIHGLGRQGIYVDAWFGDIRDIEIASNVVYGCKGAGMVLSVEEGRSVEKVSIHHNSVFNNDGSGMFFSRWGADNPRKYIQISHNVFYHNGYGTPKPGQVYYWLTGGLYFNSTKLQGVLITENIFSDNRGFQIGYSEILLRHDQSWTSVTRKQTIKVTRNLIDGRNRIGMPIRGGGNSSDVVDIFAVNGDRAVFGDPLFKDPASQNFRLRRDSLARRNRIVAGADTRGSRPWWMHDFPPTICAYRSIHKQRGTEQACYGLTIGGFLAR